MDSEKKNRVAGKKSQLKKNSLLLRGVVHRRSQKRGREKKIEVHQKTLSPGKAASGRERSFRTHMSL